MRLVSYRNGQEVGDVVLLADRVQLQEASRALPCGEFRGDRWSQRIEATRDEACAIVATPFGSFDDLYVELFLDSARPDGRLIRVVLTEERAA